MHKKYFVEVGKTYGELTCLEFAERRNQRDYYRFRCSCGNTVTTQERNVASGRSTTCGTGIHARARKHGLHRKHPLYMLWAGMRQRCNNPKATGYKNYGGRGIAVCKRWDDFATFAKDVGTRPSPEHSLDRIDNDGDYEPSNVRWATAKQQAQTRRPCAA